MGTPDSAFMAVIGMEATGYFVGCPCWYCCIKRGRFTLLDLSLMAEEVRQSRGLR
ncbi:MAG TPA: hypothetical protein VJP59_05930 [Gemmatimonadota bacterium]|nr:hypothetical protein [Gemmatimonadota bacterium]